MVDNRYTGVGYEPPFETPSDKDFMSAHIESLEAEIAALRERQRVLENEIVSLKKYNIVMSKQSANAVDAVFKLEKRQRVLVDAVEAIRDGEVWRNKIYPSDIARAALEAKEG